MEEMTITHSLEGSRGPDASPREEQHLSASSRSVILSLAVFVLSFALLFAGPALALRLIAGAVEFAGPVEGHGGSPPEVYASQAVTEVIFQDGKYPTSAYTGTKDTYINRWKPTNNMGGDVRLMFGQWGSYRPLVSFDLSPGAIPSGATVVSAELGIFCYGRNLFQDMETEVYQVVRPWESQQATWYKATSGDNWDIEGCDHPGNDRLSTPASARTVFDRLVFQWFDVTSIVQDWVSSPSSNEGMVLVSLDPTIIYYYRSSRWYTTSERPMLKVYWNYATPTPTPSPTVGPSPMPTATPVGPPLEIDNTSSCFTYTPSSGVWQDGTTGGYGGDYKFEPTVWVTAAARWAPCLADPLMADGLYDVETHWSVHSGRPAAVPYDISYDGGTATVLVDQTTDAEGATVADFSPSGWHSLGVYPFLAGTYTTTGHYVELNTSSSGDTCADAVRWVPIPGASGPPYTLTLSADPPELPSDGVSTSTIAVTVTDKFGNMVNDGTVVGLTTTLGTLRYSFMEAEDASVTKLGTWNELLHASASGGKILHSDNFGDEVVWTFEGEALSLIYSTRTTGGTADVSIDAIYVATIDFVSASTKWQVERVLTNTLGAGTHTVRVRNGGVGRIWVDAFRSGTTTTGGVATAALTAPSVPGTATVRAVAVSPDYVAASPTWPYSETLVTVPGPTEVWVDDDYCDGCANDGHTWNYDAFDTIQGGVNKVLSSGTVHVAAGTYAEQVTVDHSLSLLGAGSDVTVIDGVSDTPGSCGIYVDRADDVMIIGFEIKDFETGIELHGTGATPAARVENATVQSNKFTSNDAGSASYALTGNYVYTSTVCGNDMTWGYHGIYLSEVHGTTICYNEIYDNKGFGIKLDTGNDNSIDNNQVYGNQQAGVELTGTNLRNGVYGNTLHDLGWDGVLLNGASDTQVAANVITITNQVWPDFEGNPPDDNHNLGAIVLTGTTNVEVSGNRIYGASNAAGNRPDAAGVYLSMNTLPITIEANLIQNNIGHGIYLSSTGGKAIIHGNSIHGNGRFGLKNEQAAPDVDAEGNWWGRNTLAVSATEPADVDPGDWVDFDPPISLTLTAAPTSIPANGTATSDITATATGGGCNILDGTLITFTSDLSTLVYPGTAAFGSGVANATLRAGVVAGVATVGGTAEPGIEWQTTPVTLTALGAVSLDVTAYPETISVIGGESIVTATVRDIYNNPVPQVLMTFTHDSLGTVAVYTGTTQASTGAVTTTFTPLNIGTAIVTATNGVLVDSTSIEITAGPPCTDHVAISADPTQIPANGVATSTVTVVMTDCFGHPVPDGTMVGFTATLGSIVDLEYVEAESTDVVTSTGDWSVVGSAVASGGYFIETSAPAGAASWEFRGAAISLIYNVHGAGGVMRVWVDGGTVVDIDTNGAAGWVERVIATNLDPTVPHTIIVSRQSGTIRLDVFRSGAIAKGGTGVATAVLRSPVSSITTTGTVFAETRIGDPFLSTIVVTTNVDFSLADVVWVDDDWNSQADVDLFDPTLVWQHDAFNTIVEGVGTVKPGGTVSVLEGYYPLAVSITKTLHLLGWDAGDKIIEGSGTGNGIEVERTANGVTIEGFVVRNFGYGVYLDGRVGNVIDGITFASNVISGCATGGITATYVNNGYFADNTLYNNTDFGFDLVGGDSHTIHNNEIYGNTGFGLHIQGASASDVGNNNVISSNEIYDHDGYGIRVGSNQVDAQVMSNTVYLTNQTTGDGGIELLSSRDTIVAYNYVHSVSTAGGGTDTAGIWVGGSDRSANIHHNRILDNDNDGVLLSNFNPALPPTVNCNHIYGNGRFGVRNLTGILVDVEGNWWGHNPPAVPGPPPPADVRPASTLDWDPAITLTLTAEQSSVDVNGPTIVITATGSDGSCYLLDGTPITFEASLGLLGDPPTTTVQDVMAGGEATVLWTPGVTAGTAIITGTVPNSGVATTTVTIVPGLPASIDLVADPDSIPVGTGITSTAALTATVLDMYGNGVEDGTVILYSWTLGNVIPLSNTTTSGVATSTLHAGSVPGIASICASWGFVSDCTDVEITAGPPYTITSLTADPMSIQANGFDTSLLTAVVRDEYYSFVPDGTMVGFTTTAGSVIYGYDEAEGPNVVRVGGWTTLGSGVASGGAFIETSTLGDSVRWSFYGEAASLTYGMNAGYGRIQVQVDGGGVRVIDTDNGGPMVWYEEMMFTNLNQAVMHTMTVFCLDSATVRLDVLRSGSATLNGGAEAVLTSAPLPATTARVYATAIGGTFPVRALDMEFYPPTEVWVDDDYCSTCFNDGHVWGLDAFDNIPDGVDAVPDWGTVHVLGGSYDTGGTIDKPLFLDGAGSSTTFIEGLGTDNGIRVMHAADGVTISGFTIRDFAFGLNLVGRSTNVLDGITVTGNAIDLCTTGAITATYVDNGYFADNSLHGNNGFGFELFICDDNTIVNNHIYDNAGFGLNLFGDSPSVASDDNFVSMNYVHDVDWDGIHVGPRAYNTRVMTNTVSDTNQGTGGGYDLGGIGLERSSDTLVEGNVITYVGDGGGALADTAGVALDTLNVGAVIANNMIRHNTNHGIWISSNGFHTGNPPGIHGNSIFSNGRFGLRNEQAAPPKVDAEGNWWGQNTPSLGPGEPADIHPNGAIDYEPRIQLRLYRTPTQIVADALSTAALTATMYWDGTPQDRYHVLDGTVITLETSLGWLGAPPVVRSMVGGEAYAALQSGTIAGRAYITATTPSDGKRSTWVDFVGGMPYSIEITASPASIWAWSCRPAGKPRSSTIGVTVTDQYGNPCVGESVTYTLSSGTDASLQWTTGVLDLVGYHTTILDSGDMAGVVVVTVTAGTVSEAVPVDIMAGEPASLILTRNPAVIGADGISTSTITATVRDGCPGGNLAYDGTMVGFVTTRGTMLYDFAEAEDTSKVTRSGGTWAEDVHANASGGTYLTTTDAGAKLSWDFMGSAVSVMYRRRTSNGTARVYVDGVLERTLDTSAASTQWQRETVISNTLDPTVPHNIVVECLSGRVEVDALRSGATTLNGAAAALLTAEYARATAIITATAIDSRIEAVDASSAPTDTTSVAFERSKLSISKTAAITDVKPMHLVTFTIAYENTDDGPATLTQITDTLPVGLEYYDSVSLPDVGQATHVGGNQWVWNVGTVPGNASQVITFTARRVCEPALGTVTNTVSIDTLTLEIDKTDNADDATVNFVPGEAFEVTITSVPPGIEVDASSDLYITVTDGCNNAIAGETVYVTTTDNGSFDPYDPLALVTETVRTTNANGRIKLDFYAGTEPGMATITATAGSAVGIGHVAIGVGPAAGCYLEADPDAIPADGMSISVLTTQVHDHHQNLVADGFFVGFTTSLGSLLYDYVEVEDLPPGQLLGAWTQEYQSDASGGSYLQSSEDGATIYWDFYGNGVSVVYAQRPNGGILDVYIDSNPSPIGSIDMNGSTVWRAEKVFRWIGSSTEPHRLTVVRRTAPGTVRVDALRSGVTTFGGYAVAALTADASTGTAWVRSSAVSETEGSPIVDLKMCSAEVRFDPADLKVTKSVAPGTQVTIGENIIFTLTYENMGPVTGTSVYLEDTLTMAGMSDPYLRLADIVFSEEPITVTETPDLEYRWLLGDLAPGQSGVITVSGTVDTGSYWPSETLLTNTAVITSPVHDNDPANNTSTTTTTIVPGGPVVMLLSATPSSIKVGGKTSMIQAIVLDTYGNPVPNGTRVYFATTLGSIPPWADTIDGVASVDLTSGSWVGTAIVDAIVDTITESTQVIFRPESPFTLVLTAAPDHIVVGGATSSLQAAVADEYGNWVKNGTPVTFTTTAGWVVPTIATTYDGKAYSVLTSDTVAQTVTVTATAGIAVGTAEVVFVPGEPRVTIVAVPTVLTAGESSLITVTAKDTWGNPATDGTTVWLTTSLGVFVSDGFTSTTRTTLGGEASARVRSEQVGTALVRATVGPDSAAVAIIFQPGNPARISLTVDPVEIVGCGGTALAEVTVTDLYGNLVGDGTVIVFQAEPQGDVAPIEGGTTTNGVARGIVSSGTEPGPAHIWAWWEHDRTGVVARVQVVFLVGPPDELTLSADPSKLMVGGNRASIKLHVLDCAGYAVRSGTPVTFSIVAGEGSLWPLETTASSGWAYASLASPNHVGLVTVKAEGGDREALVDVEYVPAPPHVVNLTADPLSIPAGGMSTSHLVAEVLDQYGNYVANRTEVVFTTDLGRFVTGMSYSTSTLDGRASAVLTSSEGPGRAWIEAVAGGKRGEAFVDFYYSPTPTPTVPPTPWRHRLWMPVIMKEFWRFH